MIDTSKLYTFDLETYPNIFTGVFKHYTTGTRWIFEVSDRYNHAVELYEFYMALKSYNCMTVGYNSFGFDAQVMEYIMRFGPSFTCNDAYAKADSIINGDRDANFQSMVWDNQLLVPTIDLYKVNHFDNRARATSLKTLEFNRRSDNIGDLPFAPGKPVPAGGEDVLITYNAHDVDETEGFLTDCLDKIEFRESLVERFGIGARNYSDVKIGTEFFRDELEKVSPGICGRKNNPARTDRPIIHLKDVLVPTIEFQNPDFAAIHRGMIATSITDTRNAPELKEFSAVVGGLQFEFGTGGIHAARPRTIYETTGERTIQLRDVVSYYPNIAIKNRFYPEHLSELFCDIYEDLFNRRKSYAKGTVENAALKLALNGTYGSTNDTFSKGFFDPKYTMAITINGQLQLCMLSEMLLTVPSLELIQVNTDGVALICDNRYLPMVDEVCAQWERITKYELETETYKKFVQRDVNSYMALDMNGKVKRKGAYEYKLEWHKDFSSLVVQKAAEADLIYGKPFDQFIKNHTDKYDFMLRAKANAKSRLELDDGTKLQKTTRYHIAYEGQGLKCILPPLKKKPNEERPRAIQVGWPVAICDDIRDFNPANLNRDWYIVEARKLMI